MSETVTAPDILNEIKAGQLVVVPREARNAAAPENAGDAEALRVALELMNMRQNNGTKRDDLLYEAAAFLKRRGYLVPASPDHTKALLSLVEGMERERDAERADAGKWFREYMSLASKGPDGSTRPAFAALEARALAAAQARIRELEEAIWLAHDQLNTYRSAAVEEVIDKLETYIPGLSGKEAPDV